MANSKVRNPLFDHKARDAELANKETKNDDISCRRSRDNLAEGTECEDRGRAGGEFEQISGSYGWHVCDLSLSLNESGSEAGDKSEMNTRSGVLN